MPAKNYVLQIRLNEHERAAINRAAHRNAMDNATWVRWIAIKAASDILQEPIETLVPREPSRVTTKEPKRPKVRKQ